MRGKAANGGDDCDALTVALLRVKRLALRIDYMLERKKLVSRAKVQANWNRRVNECRSQLEALPNIVAECMDDGPERERIRAEAERIVGQRLQWLAGKAEFFDDFDPAAGSK